MALVTTDVELAADRLRRGGVVAIPTETVYGLAALADDEVAVKRMYTMKGRPASHPVIVHVASADRLAGWVADGALDGPAGLLAAACWPGPLTLLVRRGPRTGDSITGGRDTVGVRVPAHPMTAELLHRLGDAVVAPSANRFGRVSPTTAQHVIDDLGPLLDPAVDLVLDGGPCPVGVESTIVDCTVDPPQVLRPGAISADEVARLIDRPVVGGTGPSRAPGMLTAHYAPRCRVLLADDAATAQRRLADLRMAGVRAGILDRTGDLVDAARELYADLRRADAEELDALVVVLPPADGLGYAVRDRLVKAAVGEGPASPTR